MIAENSNEQVPFAIVDLQTGYFLWAGSCPVDDTASQPVAAGQKFRLLDAPVDPRTQMLDLQTDTIVDRPADINAAKRDKLIALSRERDVALLTFESSAVGGSRTYAADLASRTLLCEAAIVGGMINCAAAGVWNHQPHSVKEAQSVLADFVRQRDAVQAKHAALFATLISAASASEVDAIAWEPESL